jgi:hypothetical protein
MIMPIKRIFNRNSNNEPSSKNDFDKQILRINALEVQIKKLVEFERQVRSSLFGTTKSVKDKNGRSEEQMRPPKKSHLESIRKDVVTGQEFNQLVQKVNELSRRVATIEDITRLLKTNHYESSKTLDVNDMARNEEQIRLNKRMDELEEKYQAMQMKWEEAAKEPVKQEAINKTYYIDKFYLDKYEQNNNFAQLGIHELSGALNIGATYGKDVIPKKISEEAKAEIDKLKAAKEEMVNGQTHMEETDMPQTSEPSSDETGVTPPEEEKEFFTEIGIESDSSYE